MRVTLSTQTRRPRLTDRRLLLSVLREAAALIGLERLPGYGPEAELHVVLAGTRTMARLNAGFLGHRGVTDVLAFDLRGEAVAGEVYVCPAVAAEAAARFGTSLADECVLYAVHGMLHLAGFDDLDAASRRAMRRAEQRILRRLREKVGWQAIFADPAPPSAGPDAARPPRRRSGGRQARRRGA